MRHLYIPFCFAKLLTFSLFTLTSYFNIFPPVAQLDNAADSDSEERGFESLQAGQKRSCDLLRLRLLFSFRKKRQGFEQGGSASGRIPQSRKENKSFVSLRMTEHSINSEFRIIKMSF